MGDGDEMMDDLMSARRPVDDALDRLERGYPLTDADLATVRSELERLREERDSARSANRELAAERDEALAALRLFVHYDKPRVGIIGRFAVVDVRVNEADYHKARALLSANPPQGDAAAGSSPSDGEPCPFCGFQGPFDGHVCEPVLCGCGDPDNCRYATAEEHADSPAGGGGA